MTLSMTGFGRAAHENDEVRATVELRTVNHRFCDVKVKLPRAWAGLEQALVKRCKERLDRGRVELFARREGLGTSDVEVHVDLELAGAIVARAREVADTLGLDGLPTTAELLAMPGVMFTRDASGDASAEADLVLETLDSALDRLIEMRTAEGDRMAADLGGHIDRVAALIDEIATAAADVPTRVRARLLQRLEELLDGVAALDPVRLAQEVAIAADRAAIDGEIARLRSHVAQAGTLLELNEPVGRRLEFLVQEMGREANTIGSKASETSIAGLAVELKSVLEKIREQAANVE